MTSNDPLRRVQFYFLNSVHEVRIHEGRIIGRWNDHQPVICSGGPKPGKVIEEFVNVRHDIQSIERFTRKYGPLGIWPTGRAAEGQQFSVDLTLWFRYQTFIREVWSDLSATHKKVSSQYHYEVRQLLERGDEVIFDYERRQLVIRTSTLGEYLLLDLLSLPHERLKTCARDDCPHAYFLARHLRQKYCSEPCAWVGLRKSKLDWYYRKSGQEIHRKSTKPKTTGERKDGTRKER